MKIAKISGTGRSGHATAAAWSWLFVRLGTATLAVSVVLLAQTTVYASSLTSQGYLTSDTLPAGSIVSLQKDSTDHVVGASASNADNILGVVIDSESSQLSISAGESGQVQVVMSGVEQVLVSDINGKITAGDPITASPIASVGMKATGNVKVIGTAQDTFPNSTAKQQTYTDQKNQKHSATLGEIPVLISVAYYYKQPDKTLIPPAIQNLANAFAGKNVNSLPILISIGIFVLTLTIVASIIYAMIRSSIISVGRNPMAQSAVLRNVIQLSALVTGVLGVAVISIYLVLTKL